MLRPPPINFKAQLDNTVHEDVMGWHELGEKSENSKRLANLFGLHNIVRDGTISPKNLYRKSDHTTNNQVDHICSDNTSGSQKTYKRRKELI